MFTRAEKLSATNTTDSTTDKTTNTITNQISNETNESFEYLDAEDMHSFSMDPVDRLTAENENYVCDISMMTIADNSRINEFRSGDNKSSNDDCSCSTNTSATEPHTRDGKSDDCKTTNMYLNAVEIDRNEEEQTITELVRASGERELIKAGYNKSMRVAFGILLRLVLPLANGVARGIKGIRDARFLRILRNIASSRQALTNLVAFAANTISMNLSSVQVSHRIEPILKLMKIRKSSDGLESLPDTPSIDGSISHPSTPTTPTMCSPFVREPKGSLPRFPPSKRKTPVSEEAASKCCTINVLAEPPPGSPIRADIVLIHGLHGSLVNTWKQGLWENERRPIEFERPPKPPVRPPKRPRHTRSALIRPPHKQKRARFAHSDQWRKYSSERDTCDEFEEFFDAQGSDESGDFSYICGEPQDIEICEGVEYSFPTFRLRMNDSGRVLQAELETILSNESSETLNGQKDTEKKHNKDKAMPKPSANDPDYSKCWPGDWLPLDCPGVRVIALNYTTDQYLWRPLWKKKEPRTNLIQRAREMAELLIEQRVGYGHPIVWVGHSKGGLFVKQIIVDAWESGRPAMAPFWRSSKGVFFYSVPHRGSHLASIKAPLLTRSVELIDIEKNSKYLLDLHRRFAGLYHLGHLKVEVFSFVEMALTLMSVLYLRIVGVDSADPGIGDVCGIRLDHREICKPRSRECILYRELVKMINKVC